MTLKTMLPYLLLAYTSQFCCGLIDNMRGPTFPSMLTHFDVTASTGSFIFAISSLVGLPVIIFGRTWLRHVGSVRSHLMFSFLIAIGSAGMGLSGYLHGGFIPLLVSCAVFGAGAGGLTITMNVLVACGSSVKNRRRLFSGLHSMYGIASVLAPIIFSAAVGAGYDWRILFIGISAISFIILIPGLRTKQIVHEKQSTERPSDVSYFKRLRVGFVLSFYVAAEIVISSRLVVFAMDALKTRDTEAAMYLSAFFALLLAGRLILSVVPVPWRTYNMMMASAVLSLVLFIAGILVHPAFMSACGLTMSFFFPFGMEWISKRFSENIDFMMPSVMISIDVILLVMHWTVGMTTDAMGIRYAMFIGPAFLAATIALLVASKAEFKNI